MRRSFLPYFFAAILALGWASCDRSLEVEPWETEILTPIASTELSLRNIIGSNNYSTGDSGNVKLIFSSNLYNASGLDFFQIPETQQKNSVSLESIALSNNALSTSILLEDAYPPARLLNGQTINLPPLTLEDAGKADVDAQTFFSSALLESGKMYVEIINGFPVELDTLKFRLTNKSDGSLVAEMEFLDIPAGATVIDSADMKGVYAEGLMDGNLVKVVSAASDGPVKINAKDALTLNVSVKDLKAETATAVFPAQDLIDLDLNWRYDFGGPRIKEMRILSGKLRLQVVSTINETIYVTYEAPGLSQNGQPVLRNIVVPPAEDNQPHSEQEVVDMKGVEVNLRGKASEGFLEENALNYRMKASIKYSGKLKSISKSDSIYVYVGLEDLVPEYALGYFEQISEKIGPTSVAFDAFKNVSGDLDLEHAKFDLSIFNSTGMDAVLNFGNVISTGKSGSQVKMTADYFNTGLQVGRASNRSTPFRETFSFNTSNSNVDEFIENLPQSIEYELDLLTNPQGNSSNFQDFVYHDSRIAASLDMTVPLRLQTKGLVLTDTIDMDFNGFNDVKGLKQVDLNLIAYNYYPMDAQVKFVVLDKNFEVIDTLFNNKKQIIEPGTLDEFQERVSKPSKNLFTTSMGQKEFEYMMKYANKAIIIVQFDTYNSPYKTIYDDYRFDIKLTGNFINENSPKL